MYNILTLNKISQNGLKHLPECCYKIADECANPDGIILRSFAMHEMELPKSLLGVARAGAGVNNIPIDKCSEQGVVVFNTPGANANGVKELVLAGMFLAARDVVGGVNWVQGLQGQSEVAKTVEKGKANFGGTEISGKKLGVLGLGAIGVLVANAACALGMEVMGYDPFLSPAAKAKLCDKIKSDATVDEILAGCDYISIHVPFNAETKGMINAAALAKCKKGVKFLNFARAELVTDADMKKAIEDGIVAKYVTDFPNEHVLGTNGILTIPHLGASTEESEENCAEMAAKQLKLYLETGNIVNSVNFPAANVERQGESRVCIIKKGDCIKDTLTKLISDKGNKALSVNCFERGEYRYCIADLEKKAEDNLADAVSALPGVIKARVI